MNTFELGKTGIRISPIGLGCWQFSGGKGLAGSFWKGLSGETVEATVQAAVENGITWFDTAEAYGGGASERALSSALEAARMHPGSAVIATKWMPLLRRASTITKSFPDREEALRPYPIDLHQIHNPAGISSLEDELSRMADLYDEGRIRAIGVSNFGEKRMRTAHRILARRGIPLASNQVRYSLLDRKIERNGVLDAAEELDISIIAYSPLSQGILTGRFHENPELVSSLYGPRKYMPRFRRRSLEETRPLIEELGRIASSLESTAARIALAWTIRRHGERIVAIPGASSSLQAVSNAGAMSVILDEDQMQSLDDLTS